MKSTAKIAAAKSGPPSGSPLFLRPEAATDAVAEDAGMRDGLGDRVRSAREAKDWTPAQLATISGVSRSMILRIETGERSVTLETACKISKALGISLDVLAGQRPVGTGRRKTAALAKLRRMAADLHKAIDRLE